MVLEDVVWVYIDDEHARKDLRCIFPLAYYCLHTLKNSV